MRMSIPRTAEHVGCGHPDKFADQVADSILDETLNLCGPDQKLRREVRTAIECLAKDNLIIVSGETKWSDEIRAKLDVIALARRVWLDIGYGTNPEELTVLNHVRSQSPDIAKGTGTGVDDGGAGDQGIMVGFATDETPSMMPREWALARDMCLQLRSLSRDGTLPWLRPDCKTQVTLDENGTVIGVIVATQHADGVPLDEVREQVLRHVVKPIAGIDEDPRKINGTGKFVIGGPTGDAGVVGRKIVVDAYGPRVSVGGGAYSGKDPTKVDRSAAYMARHIAKAAVAHKVRSAKECTVQIAYGIGQLQPEMVTAVTDTGEDISAWVKEKFPDLSPRSIIDRLGLLNPQGWSYFETASYGHYGREQFPWEAIAEA